MAADINVLLTQPSQVSPLVNKPKTTTYKEDHFHVPTILEWIHDHQPLLMSPESLSPLVL